MPGEQQHSLKKSDNGEEIMIFCWHVTSYKTMMIFSDSFFTDLARLQRRGIAWDFSEHCVNLSNCKVVLRLPIQLIIGDCQGHDELYERYNNH
jgi:hypothetical protein